MHFHAATKITITSEKLYFSAKKQHSINKRQEVLYLDPNLGKI